MELSALLLVAVGRAKGDVVAGLAALENKSVSIVDTREYHGVKNGSYQVSAVHSTQLGGQDNSADEGEKHGNAVESEHDNGNSDRRYEGGYQSVDSGEPRQNRDEDGEVDGGLAGARGAVVVCDRISDESSDQQSPEQLDDAQNIV